MIEFMNLFVFVFNFYQFLNRLVFSPQSLILRFLFSLFLVRYPYYFEMKAIVYLFVLLNLFLLKISIFFEKGKINEMNEEKLLLL